MSWKLVKSFTCYGDSMTELEEIERNWECTKLLVCGETDRKYLAFKLGEYGIYLWDFQKLDIANIRRLAAPSIATIRYCERGALLDFVELESQFKASIIFKHGDHFSKLEDAVGLVANTVTNAMNLRPGSIFYIDSNNSGVRKFFYQMAKRINEEDNLGCKFDYDCYNYKLYIKEYKKRNGQLVLVVIMTGKDMPNSWKYDQDEFCQEDCCEEEQCVYGDYKVLSNGIWILSCMVELCEDCGEPLDECICDDTYEDDYESEEECCEEEEEENPEKDCC